jgi:uncharacterized protein
VLSGAFTFGGFSFDPERTTLTEQQIDERVRAENDWTAAQVARFPERLVAFCSFHPQSSSALDELRRCSRDRRFRGVKLHLEESDIDLTNPVHLAAVRAVFAEANRLRMPIVIHPRSNRVDAVATTRAFIDEVLPAAPDVVVQVAHLHGGGRYSEPALRLYAEAVAAQRPGTRNLWFDLTDIARTPAWEEANADIDAIMQGIVAYMRTIGLDRMLYGSDPAVYGRLAPREGWAEFRRVMPLTDDEIADIADNVAPYMR